MHTNVARVIPLVLWCALIFYLSSQPSVSVSDERYIDVFIHKLAHVIEYCVLYLLFIYAFANKMNRNKVLAGGILFAFLYGISDEIHQSFVPTRSPRATDVVIDTVGAVIGYGMLKFLFKYK